MKIHDLGNQVKAAAVFTLTAHVVGKGIEFGKKKYREWKSRKSEQSKDSEERESLHAK